MTDGTGRAGAAARGTAAPARRRVVTAAAALVVAVTSGCGAPDSREQGAAARASRGPGVPGDGAASAVAGGTAAASPGAEPRRAGSGAEGATPASGAGNGPASGAGLSGAESGADAPGDAGEAGPGVPATPSDPAPPPGLPSSAPLEVRLGAACVRPGDTQRVEIETLPEAYVAYDNLYPDNRDGSVHGGVDGQARSDREGRFTATWVVAPGTPLGRVRIDVGVSAPGGSAITMRYYRLAARC